MTATGFPKNYFTAHELGSKNLKDKTSKVAFLNKLIYLVSVCHGSEINVRPSKIVAGSEPLNTNMLLTLFGRAAVSPNIDHVAVIKHCQFGGKIGDLSSMKKAVPPVQSKEEEKVEDEGKQNLQKESDNPKNVDDLKNPILETTESNDEKVESSSPPRQLSEQRNTSESEMIHIDEPKRSDTMDSLRQMIQQCNDDPMITRQMTEQIVTKPKCTEKLLKKPPFRFLHDLFMAINKATNLGLEKICR